jgi:hypothetical protein
MGRHFIVRSTPLLVKVDEKYAGKGADCPKITARK